MHNTSFAKHYDTYLCLTINDKNSILVWHWLIRHLSLNVMCVMLNMLYGTMCYIKSSLRVFKTNWLKVKMTSNLYYFLLFSIITISWHHFLHNSSIKRYLSVGIKMMMPVIGLVWPREYVCFHPMPGVGWIRTLRRRIKRRLFYQRWRRRRRLTVDA